MRLQTALLHQQFSQLSLKSAVALLLCIKSIFIEVVTPSIFVPKLLQIKLQTRYAWNVIIVHLGVSAVSNCMMALVDNQEVDIAQGEKWVPLVKEIQEDLVYHHNDLVLLQWLLPVWNGNGNSDQNLFCLFKMLDI